MKAEIIAAYQAVRAACEKEFADDEDLPLKLGVLAIVQDIHEQIASIAESQRAMASPPNPATGA